LKSKLQETLEKKSKVITAELMPPRGGSPIRSLKIAQLLKDKVHAVNITDGSRAVMRMCSLEMSKLLLQNEIEPEKVSSLITKGLKEKIEANARDLNFLPKVARLPI